MWTLLSKEGSITYLRPLLYCKVCEAGMDLSVGKGTELVHIKILVSMMFKWDSSYFNVSYIYSAHNTQLYLIRGDSQILRICALPLETAWDRHQLHSKTILYPDEMCHPAEGAIGLSSQTRLLSFYCRNFTFVCVCVLLLVINFVCLFYRELGWMITDLIFFRLCYILQKLLA